MKSLSNYINNELSVPKLKPSEPREMEAWIFDKLTSRKFRHSSMPSELEKLVRENIAEKVKNNLPIILVVPLGGYKKRQLPTAPFVDWSEVFDLILFHKLCFPIVSTYKPGVFVDYVSGEMDMHILGNYTREQLLAYTQSFQELIRQTDKYRPANFKIGFRELRDQFSSGEYESKLKSVESTIKRLRKKYEDSTEEVKIKKFTKAARNYQFTDQENLLSDAEKREIIINKAVMHDLVAGSEEWDKVLASKDFVDNDNKIPVSFYKCSWGIHYKSAQDSTVQFWVGTGVVKQQNNVFIESILSLQQFLEVKDKITYVPVSLFSSDLVNLQKMPQAHRAQREF